MELRGAGGKSLAKLVDFATPIALAYALCFSTCAIADVLEASENGFRLKFQYDLSAPPERAYQALIDLGTWWDPDHTYSGKAENLSLDLTAGGCLCEVWDNGAVEHLRLVYFQDNKHLRFRGGLGPLQGLAVSGAMDFVIEPIPGGSRLTFTYQVAGVVPLKDWAKPVDGVWRGHLERYAALFSPDRQH